MRESIGNFLLRRLQEAGIRHIFGVPGDYNRILDNTPSWPGIHASECLQRTLLIR